MQEFLSHVKQGLSQSPKKLSSRYFYDAKGDALFQQIMKMDAYYLPRCEMQIIQQQSEQIAKDISTSHSGLQIVELGAGDGSKTKHLLKQFGPYFKPMEYVAMDISPNVLAINEKLIKTEVVGINHRKIAGNYFETYKNLTPITKGRLVLFLGANIGNYPTPEAIDFFNFVKSNLTKNDYFLVAFDLVKHPRKIIAAYDDHNGITKQFNLNLLERINRELGANFEVSDFDHFPFYNPITGITSSHIISLKQQTVEFPDGFTINFEAFEAIHTEVSKKFFWSDIEAIAHQSKMRIVQTYLDQQKAYAFVLFQPHA
ncbi:L-histidine N(alpha)-methyltransferase [Paucihalobacter sp.]|uniref:L-histidine N(alpha)-methyltransferase n=1 Tax=Paucihalobacter sp. TaxID=2850405 RepID=UPI003D16186C